MLEGSVRKAGNRLRITAQLVDVHSDTHLRSERFDRQLDDVFAIQDEIAGNIVKALRVMLSESEKRLACSYSLLGQTEDAIACLEKAVANGMRHWEWLAKDSDFDAIRGNPRFEALLNRLAPAAQP